MNSNNSSKLLSKSQYKSYFDKGIGFTQYQNEMMHAIEHKTAGEYQDYLPMNMQRTKRILKTVSLSDELKKELSKLQRTVNWLVISEYWCGDASQIVPVINMVALASLGKINLRIVYRDENPELINAHLTNGSKSIPILLQFDDSFNFVGEYGPRPLEAQQLVMQLKANPESALTYQEKLHKWYSDDKAVSIQRDLMQLLELAIKK